MDAFVLDFRWMVVFVAVGEAINCFVPANPESSELDMAGIFLNMFGVFIDGMVTSLGETVLNDSKSLLILRTFQLCFISVLTSFPFVVKQGTTQGPIWGIVVIVSIFSVAFACFETGHLFITVLFANNSRLKASLLQQRPFLSRAIYGFLWIFVLGSILATDGIDHLFVSHSTFSAVLLGSILSVLGIKLGELVGSGNWSEIKWGTMRQNFLACGLVVFITILGHLIPGLHRNHLLHFKLYHSLCGATSAFSSMVAEVTVGLRDNQGPIIALLNFGGNFVLALLFSILFSSLDTPQGFGNNKATDLYIALGLASIGYMFLRYSSRDHRRSLRLSSSGFRNNSHSGHSSSGLLDM